MPYARVVNLLMLALLAFVASGSARLWHERFGHTQHDHSAVVPTDHDVQNAPVDPHPAGETHCETCAVLAQLTTIVLTTFVAMLIGAAVVCLRVVSPQLTRCCVDLPALPGRGPPALA